MLGRPAAGFAWINVAAISTAWTIPEIRKRRTIRCIINIHAITKSVIRGDVKGWIEYSGYGSQRDIGYIIEYATTIGIACRIACQ